MRPLIQSDGQVLVPTRAEGPSGLLGDGMLPLTPSHPQYKEWRKWLAANPGKVQKQ